MARGVSSTFPVNNIGWQIGVKIATAALAGSGAQHHNPARQENLIYWNKPAFVSVTGSDGIFNCY